MSAPQVTIRKISHEDGEIVKTQITDMRNTSHFAHQFLQEGFTVTITLTHDDHDLTKIR